MTGTVGYDLERVASLRHRTIQALGELGNLRSDDPFADEIVAAIRSLHRILEHDWLPALAEIERRDPLTTPGRITDRSTGLSTGSSTGSSTGVTARALLEPRSPTTWTDDQIFELIDRLGAQLLTSDSPVRSLDVFGSLRVVDASMRKLADEIARRAGADDAFASGLISRMTATPLIGLLATLSPFPSDVTVALLATALASTSHVDDVRTRSDAAAVDALLRSLDEHPGAALDLLDDPSRLRELLDWPFTDPEVVADVVVAGLLAPAAEPDRLLQAHSVLRHLVTVTNDPFVDRGTFRHPIPSALAAGVAVHLPTFVASLEEGDTVNLKGADGRNTGAELGTYEEVLDFLGTMLREPGSASILLATLDPLTSSAATGDATFDVADVGDFALALVNAAENERLEDELHTAAVRSLTGYVTVAVGLAAGSVAAALHLGSTSTTVLSHVVNRAGELAIERVDSTTTGDSDAAAAAEIAIEMALYETFLDDPGRFSDHEGPLDPASVDAAQRSMRSVRALARSGASLVELERLLEDVHLDVVALGGADFVAPLDRGSIRALDVHRSGATDLTRPLD